MEGRMIRAKHTPGPREHCLDLDPPDPSIEASGGGCVARVQCHGNVNTSAREGEEFSHADARLIAEAPDLWDRLVALLSGWSVTRVYLYDKEGVDGWTWTEPGGTEHTEIGDWSGLPPWPDSARKALNGS